MDYNWSIYEKDWHGYNPSMMGELLIRELHLQGDPVALAWWPQNSLPGNLEKHIYRGPLKLLHCQFMQRARFRGETYILDGATSRPPPPVCNGDAYQGLAPIFTNLTPGVTNSRSPQGAEANLQIYGSPIASRRDLREAYSIIPPDIKHLGIAPLSECPFDPDVIVLIGNARQLTMAARALMYFSGKALHGLTGPGTCSSSWAAAYLKGEPRFTLGCHGVFGSMGLDPDELTLSVPGELMPTLCQNLELWRDRGKNMFQEDPPNEKREFVKVPLDTVFVKGDEKKSGYVSFDDSGSVYESWAERRMSRGLPVPEKV
jgi:uncharacterized protein (DUF169 family)